MAKRNAKKKKTQRVPEEAMKQMNAVLDRLGDPMLEADRVGRFCYITHAGAPLCRLAWTAAGDDLWDFAIYKYSTSKYGRLDLAPARASALDCIETALGAYDLR